MTARPNMSLSLDLDNKWSYLKTHGNDAWRNYPGYLPLVVPRILDFLAQRDLSITFFIVGKDATLDENKEVLGEIAAAGHEIGNHSFIHDPWLHLYSATDLEREFEKAEEAIEAVTRIRTRAFRGPGFSLSTDTLNVLGKRGYDFDATAFPNALNPLARAYFFSKSRLTAAEKKQRSALFGTFSDALRPVKPYRWTLPSGALLEIPVTTLPLFRVPIHFSYLLYLASFSRTAARLYTRTAVALCRATRTEPSLLLHPLDFMGEEDDDDLTFFPAMNMPVTRKLEIMDELFAVLLDNFDACTMGEFARNACGTDVALREFPPSFPHRSEGMNLGPSAGNDA